MYFYVVINGVFFWEMSLSLTVPDVSKCCQFVCFDLVFHNLAKFLLDNLSQIILNFLSMPSYYL